MKRRSFLALNIALTTILAGLATWIAKPWEVWQLDLGFIGLFVVALGCDLLLVFVWAHRHALVLEATGWGIAPLKLIPLVTFSNTANNLTPAATGEVARAWYLKRNLGIPIDKAGGAIVFERIFMFGLMALSALTATVAATDQPGWLILLCCFGILAYVLALPVLISPLARRIRRRPRPRGRIKGTVWAVANQGLQLWGDRRVATKTAAWSAFAFALIGFVFWLASLGSGLNIGWLQIWALVGGGTVAGVISALPFGLGAAELTAAGIGLLVGLDSQLVAATFVLHRVFFTFPLGVAGAVSLARLNSVRSKETTTSGK